MPGAARCIHVGWADREVGMPCVPLRNTVKDRLQSRFQAMGAAEEAVSCHVG